MKILHTSDWHLGQKLLYNDREEEHRLALDWLLETIREQEVSIVLVAGDIFDIGNPPNYARKLYYSFLQKILRTPCRHIVITGGNHDSPAMLNAPRELLQTLNIHLVGAATEDIADELIVLRDKQGEIEAVVAAVPFLRDKDLRLSIAGETYEERRNRLQAGLRQHYDSLAELAAPYTALDVPILAMGHLYADGAVASDRQDNIYIGNRENMEASQFPTVFDYVALGHIHRAQQVGKTHHIRYSGALIPLSFSETKDDKSVYVLDFKGKELTTIHTVAVPVFRRLKTVQGDLDEVQAALDKFAAKPHRQLTPWVEAIVQTEAYIPQLDVLLREYTSNMSLELVKIKLERPNAMADPLTFAMPELEDLSVEEVFHQKCLSQGELSDADWEALLDSFRELQEWMTQKEVP